MAYRDQPATHDDLVALQRRVQALEDAAAQRAQNPWHLAGFTFRLDQSIGHLNVVSDQTGYTIAIGRHS